MKKITKLSESDLRRIVNRVMSEHFYFDGVGDAPKTPDRSERKKVKSFINAINQRLENGGFERPNSSSSNPPLSILIDGIRDICNQYERYLEEK